MRCLNACARVTPRHGTAGSSEASHSSAHDRTRPKVFWAFFTAINAARCLFAWSTSPGRHSKSQGIRNWDKANHRRWKMSRKMLVISTKIYGRLGIIYG